MVLLALILAGAVSIGAGLGILIAMMEYSPSGEHNPRKGLRVGSLVGLVIGSIIVIITSFTIYTDSINAVVGIEARFLNIQHYQSAIEDTRAGIVDNTSGGVQLVGDEGLRNLQQIDPLSDRIRDLRYQKVVFNRDLKQHRLWQSHWLYWPLKYRVDGGLGYLTTQ